MILAVLLLYLLILFSIQTTLLDVLAIAGVTPDLALIFVVYCGFNMQKNYGVGMGLLVGFLQDCLSGGLLGVNTLSKGLIGLFFSTLKDTILVRGAIPVSFFLVTASLMDGLVYYVVLVLLLKGQAGGSFFFPDLFVYLVYNAVAGLLLFYVFDFHRKWIQRKIPNEILRVS